MAMMSALITSSLSSLNRSQHRYNKVCSAFCISSPKHFLIWMRLITTPLALLLHLKLMKRFFSKSSKNQPSTPAVSPHNDIVHTPELPPKFVVPPVPHPRPHDHIAVLPTQDGLLLKPHITGQGGSNHYVRITWGKTPEIEEVQGAMQNANVNWAVAIIVYGIVGILELFTGSLSSIAFLSTM